MTKQVKAVGVIFEDPEGSILVLRRHKKSPEGRTWGLVGGNIDEGEDKVTAALREVQEEISHSIKENDLKYLRSYHWERDDVDLSFDVFKYRISQDEVEINLDEQENTEHIWATPKNLHSRSDLMIGLYPILEDEYGI